MNTQPSMNTQPMRLPVSGLMPQQPEAPSGRIMNSQIMVVPGSVAQGLGHTGPPQTQQNPTGIGPGQPVETGSQQPQPGNQQQGAVPGAADSPSQAPPGGQQQQPGTVRERHTIWQGVLEWVEKAKTPSDTQKLTHYVPCQVSASPKDGEPVLKADSWPQKLIMQLMPKQLIGNIGSAYLKNSKSVFFHPQQCEAVESLTKVMSSGFAGCVHFTSMSSPASCDIKVLILLYTSKKRAYLGLIPNDQAAFVDRLRKVIQHQKSTQAIRQQGQVQQNQPQQQQMLMQPGLTNNPLRRMLQHFCQQQQQQQQQRQMNPQNMQPNQQRQQQQRLVRPGLPNNAGLRHLLQQQPQYRQQVLNTMQLNGPRGQQNPGSQGQPPQQFEDSFDFLS